MNESLLYSKEYMEANPMCQGKLIFELKVGAFKKEMKASTNGLFCINLFNNARNNSP